MQSDLTIHFIFWLLPACPYFLPKCFLLLYIRGAFLPKGTNACPPSYNGGFFYVIGNCSAALGHKRMFSAKAVFTDCVSRYSTFLFSVDFRF